VFFFWPVYPTSLVHGLTFRLHSLQFFLIIKFLLDFGKHSPSIVLTLDGALVIEPWDTCAEFRVTAGAWEMYVVHCIVTL
jgi:hypothetical protein